MCLSVLAGAIEDGEIAIEGFSVNVVRARLPSVHVRRGSVAQADGAGADVFSVETVAWGRRSEDGSLCRYRVLDLGLRPPLETTDGPSPELICEQIVESLRIVSEALPEAPPIVVVPYELPLGPPHSTRDVATTRISDSRVADQVRAQPENRIPAADFVAALAPLLPRWTLLGAVEPGRSDVYALQEGIRAGRKRSASILKSQRNHHPIEWLVTTPDVVEDRDQLERLRRLVTEWQGEANPEGLDQRRPGGHRVMFHGNVEATTADALTQAFLAYSLAEQLDPAG